MDQLQKLAAVRVSLPRRLFLRIAMSLCRELCEGLAREQHTPSLREKPYFFRNEQASQQQHHVRNLRLSVSYLPHRSVGKIQ